MLSLAVDVVILSAFLFNTFRLLTGLRKMAHSSKEDDVRLVDILRIYNDKNGNSQFRSFKIEMKGSG